MSESITNVEDAVAALGALPMPVGMELEHLRRERDAFRDQRNAVVATNERLLAEVQESNQARLHAENETRTVNRQFADAAATVARLVAERGQRMKVENALRDEVEELRARIAELEAERHSTNEALDDAVQELRDRRECAFKNPHEPHTNEPGRPDEWQCPGVQRTAELGGAS